MEIVEKYNFIAYEEEKSQYIKVYTKDYNDLHSVDDSIEAFEGLVIPYEHYITTTTRFGTETGIHTGIWIDYSPSNYKLVPIKERITTTTVELEINYEELCVTPFNAEIPNIRVMIYDFFLDKNEKQINATAIIKEGNKEICKPSFIVNKPEPDLQNCYFFENSEELMKSFSKFIDDTDPDIIISFGKRYLSLFKTSSGRSVNKSLNIVGREFLSFIQYPEFIKQRSSNTLEGYCHEILNKEIPTLKNPTFSQNLPCKLVYNVCQKRLDGLIELIDHYKFVESTVQMSSITFVSLYQSSFRITTQMVLSKILEKCHTRNFVINSNDDSHSSGLRGGSVIEPEHKYYKNSFTSFFDFQSLYPSLIIAKNICFSTCLPKSDDLAANKMYYRSNYLLKHGKDVDSDEIVQNIQKELDLFNKNDSEISNSFDNNNSIENQMKSDNLRKSDTSQNYNSTKIDENRSNDLLKSDNLPKSDNLTNQILADENKSEINQTINKIIVDENKTDSLIKSDNLTNQSKILNKSSNLDEIEVHQIEGSEKDEIPFLKFVSKEKREGILPEILKDLLKSREEVKSQIEELRKENKLKEIEVLDCRQQAIKIVCNSVYGFTSFQTFGIDQISAEITRQGRVYHYMAMQFLQTKNYNVIYGDTDSLFVNFGSDDYSTVYQKSLQICEEMNEKIFENPVKIRLEKIYKNFIIFSKKHYAGIRMDLQPNEIDIKGIETEKSDSCEFLKDLIFRSLSIILQKTFDDGVNFVKEMMTKMYNGMIPLSDFIIQKQLGQNINEYRTKTVQCEVAKKMIERDRKILLGKGDKIRFLVYKGKKLTDPLYSRADEPVYVVSCLKEIDYNYYVTKLIIPTLERIFMVINVEKTEKMINFLKEFNKKNRKTGIKKADKSLKNEYLSKCEQCRNCRFDDIECISIDCDICLQLTKLRYEP
ncbi:DNA polymerase family B containing protein [Trichomonas vaginalis G3]|uniref:DNA polymerase n=1 Tax=Trichomonas vaginalis (strain ATCC PRA-98 / G3) TaxID=412133 RepID=A2E9P0_TRIV3|nr:DNA polymerase zeta catalytic subunit family [Trichomonas vaginalis G3]EAY10575.1 DNA polymerase family B containing protein [Trichomonas vaginalis G3]KAI5540824.1 DNA polymerase zeta catalytic subunit family [Trichomonas vaginalis G3]|eukprot:XP_001322798.1 DNA polymerase family B containing protein [Trichomonas vaginalis G3]